MASTTGDFSTLILRDIAANRPTFGIPGRLFFNLTVKRWQRDTGSAWEDCEEDGALGGSTGGVDNAVLRSDGIGGATVQASLMKVDDNGSVNIPAGQTYKIDGVDHTHAPLVFTLNYTIGNRNDVVATGVYGLLIADFPCTIQAVRLLPDQPGDIVIDIWKTSFALFAPGTHPVAGDSICASARPTLSNASKFEDTTLPGWMVSVAAHDVFCFNVVSAATLKQVLVGLQVVRA